MRLKMLIDEDFTNYKKPAMFIGAISCGGKCCHEANLPTSICQNDEWRNYGIIQMKIRDIIERYSTNPITKAIVFGGLEPFEQWDDLYNFIFRLRKLKKCNDDVVIYTGYYPYEISKHIEELKEFDNIIVKFGRFVPNDEKHFDETLGVYLANKEQFAERISEHD